MILNSIKGADYMTTQRDALVSLFFIFVLQLFGDICTSVWFFKVLRKVISSII